MWEKWQSFVYVKCIVSLAIDVIFSHNHPFILYLYMTELYAVIWDLVDNPNVKQKINHRIVREKFFSTVFTNNEMKYVCKDSRLCLQNWTSADI